MKKIKIENEKRIASRDHFQVHRFCVLIGVLIFCAWLPTLTAGDRLPAAYTDKKFSISLQDVDLAEVLKLIAQQGGVNIEIDKAIKDKATYSFTNSTLEDAIKQIAADHKLNYYKDDGVVYVEKAEGEQSEGASDSSVRGANVYTVSIKNSSAKTIMDKLPKIFREGESLIVNEASNSLVFYGSESSKRKLLHFVTALDQLPVQIMIEAQIIETSKNFIRDIGFRWGETSGDMALNRSALATGNATAGAVKDPNLTAKFLLGWIDKRTIEAHILAAENSGQAKIISRPKVVTLNNQMATINSGLTYYVKTISNVAVSGASSGSSAATGGLQTVNAGLQLSISPLIVGTDLIRMQINVTNSSTDSGLQVDGIPGINDNSANTSIIVRDGNTAVIAGLIKSNLSKASTSVPFLARIPLLGWLFRSQNDKDVNTELVILISPKIISTEDSYTPKVEAKADVKVEAKVEVKSEAKPEAK